MPVRDEEIYLLSCLISSKHGKSMIVNSDHQHSKSFDFCLNGGSGGLWVGRSDRGFSCIAWNDKYGSYCYNDDNNHHFCDISNIPKLWFNFWFAFEWKERLILKEIFKPQIINFFSGENNLCYLDDCKISLVGKILLWLTALNHTLFLFSIDIVN
jgi:hypothetical protein